MHMTKMNRLYRCIFKNLSFGLFCDVLKGSNAPGECKVAKQKVAKLQKTLSHKSKILRNYTADFKLNHIKHAEESTTSSTARQFKVDRKITARWISTKYKSYALDGRETIERGEILDENLFDNHSAR